jgi:hypothetical protein
MPKILKIQYSESGYYFIIVVLLAFAGFWPSYFKDLFNDQVGFTSYIHVHALIMITWVLLLVVQPLCIRYGRFQLHRRVGKWAYIHVALIYLSAILLIHSRIPFISENSSLGLELFIPLKDLLIFGVAYGFAMYYRKTLAIHARYMVSTAFVFIEPALVRFIGAFIPVDSPYLWTVLIIDSILLYLIIRDRQAKEGRWVFPMILILYLLVQAYIIFNADFSLWNNFAEWFAGLNIT